MMRLFLTLVVFLSIIPLAEANRRGSSTPSAPPQGKKPFHLPTIHELPHAYGWGVDRIIPHPVEKEKKTKPVKREMRMQRRVPPPPAKSAPPKMTKQTVETKDQIPISGWFHDMEDIIRGLE